MVTFFYGIGQKSTTLHELLDSDSFDAVIKLDKSQALPIIVELSETLSYIHDKGFLHNDIKSDNIVFYVESAKLKPVLLGNANFWEKHNNYIVLALQFCFYVVTKLQWFCTCKCL